MKAISTLGVGPMSSEVIEATFRYAQEQSVPLMLISSKNQIDWDGGYVNGWNTKQYMDYVKELRMQYPNATVYVCRDHCGPGFKSPDIEDVYKTIDDDIANDFDLIHIDFCHYQGSYEELLNESKKAIKHIKSKRPDMMLEIGTDENKGEFLDDIKRIEHEMEFFSDIDNLQFYVCQTGSVTREINQAGSFNEKFLREVRTLSDKYNLNLKEHNGDYLRPEQIQLRKGIINAINVAPQYGVIQTSLLLEKCLTYGIDFTEFVQHAYESKRWEKWLETNTADNKMLCAVIAGHYVFNSDQYRKLVEQINQHEDFSESVIQAMMNNFDLYIKNV